MAVFITAIGLVACSAPRVVGDPAGDLAAASLDGYQGAGAATEPTSQDEERRSCDIILAAGGSKPPPRPPPSAPRAPGRVNPRDRANEPTQPGRVPGRRLAGPPDAPYWETVFEIPWRGGGLQGPKPAPPEPIPGRVAEPSPPAPPTAARPQAGPPPSRLPAPTSQLRSRAAGSGPKAGSADPANAGKRFPESVKEQARAESGGKCVFCGTKTGDASGPTKSEIDHSIPKSRGGDNTIDNAQNACRTCNRTKSSETTEEFLK